MLIQCRRDWPCAYDIAQHCHVAYCDDGSYVRFVTAVYDVFVGKQVCGWYGDCSYLVEGYHCDPPL